MHQINRLIHPLLDFYVLGGDLGLKIRNLPKGGRILFVADLIVPFRAGFSTLQEQVAGRVTGPVPSRPLDDYL